jgi:hypothetical protein
MNFFRNDGLSRYFTLLSTPTASTNTAHSPAFAITYVWYGLLHPCVMPSDHLVFCPPAYFVIEEPSPTRQRMDGGGIIGFEYRDGPDEPPRLMLITKNGKASLHSHSASVRTFLSSVVTLSDVRLSIYSSRSCTCSGDERTLRSLDKYPTSCALSSHSRPVPVG